MLCSAFNHLQLNVVAQLLRSKGHLAPFEEEAAAHQSQIGRLSADGSIVLSAGESSLCPFPSRQAIDSGNTEETTRSPFAYSRLPLHGTRAMNMLLLILVLVLHLTQFNFSVYFPYMRANDITLLITRAVTTNAISLFPCIEIH